MTELKDNISRFTNKRTWKEKSEEWRTKIKVTQTLNRLQSYVLGEDDPQTSKPVEMTPAQVKAAQVLLNKAMPDLSQADITNTSDTPIDYKALIANLTDKLGPERAKELLEAIGHVTH